MKEIWLCWQNPDG